MTVTLNPPIQIASGAWYFTWTSTVTSPLYRVFYQGTETLTNSGFIIIESDSPPIIDVLDDLTAESSQQAYPGVAVIQWFGDDSASYYNVQQYVSGNWTTIGTVYEEGRGYSQFQSGWLADAATHQFRVVPYGAADDAGDPLAFGITIARQPDAPDVTMTYDADTGDLTIAAA